MVEQFLRLYDEQDRKLVACVDPETGDSFPPTSRWWRREIERFIRSGKRRWVIRVGRRGGKSSTLIRVLVCWGLSGMWRVPQGDTGIIPLMSIDKEEAKARVVTIKAVLKALGVEARDKALNVDVVEKRLRFRVYAATTGSVGMTSIAVLADEMARWPSGEFSANPAKLVMQSVRPSMATQRLAFEICSSSPWGTDDYHAELYDLGETPGQVTSYAPTWVANDNFITEQETHDLEPDEKAWQREYKAIPGAVLTKAFDPEHVKACFGREPRGVPGERGWVSIDASSGREDGYCYGGGVVTSGGSVVMREIRGWTPGDIPDTDAICEAIAFSMDQLRAAEAWGDQCERKGLLDGMAKKSKAFFSLPWSEPSKELAFTFLRRLMREGRLCLPDHPELRRQMLKCEARKMPSGKVRYQTNGLDYLSVLVTFAHAVNAGRYRVGDGKTIDWDMVDEFGGVVPGVFGLD